MYLFYNAQGFTTIFYFIVVVFIAHLMLMRLYIAVFLCSFRESLHSHAESTESTKKL